MYIHRDSPLYTKTWPTWLWSSVAIILPVVSDELAVGVAVACRPQPPRAAPSRATTTAAAASARRGLNP